VNSSVVTLGECFNRARTKVSCREVMADESGRQKELRGGNVGQCLDCVLPLHRPNDHRLAAEDNVVGVAGQEGVADLVETGEALPAVRFVPVKAHDEPATLGRQRSGRRHVLEADLADIAVRRDHAKVDGRFLGQLTDDVRSELGDVIGIVALREPQPGLL
jgi:hypothetical protein